LSETLTTNLKPRLRTFDMTMVVAGLVIGMGIFRTPVEVAQKAGIPEVFFLVWIVGALVSLAGALTFAEIGSRYPVAGGFYKIFTKCYSPRFAFMVNWVIVVSNAASTAGVAIMGSAYIAPVLFPGWDQSTTVPAVGVAAILLIGSINLAGIKMSARLMNVLMIIKISLLVALILSPLFISGEIATPAAPVAPIDPIQAFFLCFIPVFFTYGGYQQTINFGSDVHHASKNLPRAIMMGMGIVTVVYLAVNFSYYKVLGLSGMQSTTTLASDIMGLMLGSHAQKIVSVIMFLSVMAFVNVSVMSNPRVYLAMSEDRVLPPAFRKVNSRTQVPETGVIVFCIFILTALFFLNSFQRILEFVMFFDSVSLITAAATIFVLRKQAKINGEPTDIYKMKGYPWIPALFILVYGAVMVSVFIANPELFLWGIALFALGYPMYGLIRKYPGKQENTD
jgi:APA family basic amino acid/polyamine antiporter